MGFQVFISHSSKDKPVGDAVCAFLEQRGVRCWIAPRDILPGSEWGTAIMDGLTACQVFVLVFSEHANQSPQVRRELERAVHHGLVIIPFRIEDVAPAKAMEYFMSVPHWLDAMTPPLEQHLDKLGDVVARVLDDPAAARDQAVPPTRKLDARISIAALAALVALPALAAYAGFDPPWPKGVGLGLGLGLGLGSVPLVAAGVALPHFTTARLGRGWVLTVVAGLVIASIAYLALQSLFVETMPVGGERVVKGFTCTPDALLVFGDNCPDLGSDALQDAGWNAELLWTASSLMVVRLGMATAWLALMAGLALAAARVERMRMAPAGRRAG